MNPAEHFLQQQLERRQENGLLRKLITGDLPYDFCSNDYLGFARSAQLKTMIADQLQEISPSLNGSTGSRLLAGNHAYTEKTEQHIADYHEAEAGLIFNSGYDANVGLLSSVPQRGDTIITDELIHASLIDGARLSHADRVKFRHNNCADLEKKLQQAKGLKYVVVESVYSMDGDIAPLREIAELCRQHEANLIVDEAHAIGVFGPGGKGLAAELRLNESIFAKIVTFGKALGTHGAAVLGSKILRSYLVNFARSFIYTTAAPLHAIVSINCAYQLLADGKHQVLLQNRIETYNRVMEKVGFSVAGKSAIQTVVLPGNEVARQAAQQLQHAGFDVRAILSPTVPAGKERLRICLHAFNSDEEIRQLIAHLKSI